MLIGISQGSWTIECKVNKKKLVRLLYEATNRENNDEETSTTLIIMKIKNLHPISSSIDLSKTEIELMNMLDKERILNHILELHKNIYDYILIRNFY